MSIYKKPDWTAKKLLDSIHKKIDELAKKQRIEENESVDLISKLNDVKLELQTEDGFFKSSFKASIVEEFIYLESTIDADEFKPQSLKASLDSISQYISKINKMKPQFGNRNRNQNRPPEKEHELQSSHNQLRQQQLSFEDDLMVSKGMETLKASFHNLKDFNTKLCLLSFSIFPENCVIKKRPMIYWWIGEGFVNSDSDGDVIYQDLIDKELIVPVFYESPTSNACRLNPWIRRMLVSLAKEAGFCTFDEMKTPQIGSRRAFLNKHVLVLLENNSINVDIKEGSLATVFNLGARNLNSHATMISRSKKLLVLQLGRWQVSAEHHIEVDKDESLDGLKTQKQLKYLSLRGISRITKLPRGITELNSLEILDLRACHNLETLPSDISTLKNLTHLDISECYLLERMPKGFDKLHSLVVLKGFVIGDKRKPNAQISDLTQLEKLTKLSIYIRGNAINNEEELKALEKIKSLRKLTLSWRKDTITPESSRIMSITFPEHLQKLDLRYIPEETPEWLHPSKLGNLKKLYIKGGSLSRFSFLEDLKWQVKILRLRYLKSFTITTEDLDEMFPGVVWIDIRDCSPQQTHLPQERRG